MRWSLCALLLSLALAPDSAQAEEKVRVAIAKVRARKAARPGRLEKGIRAGVAGAGAQVIGAGALANAARDVGVKSNSAEGARAVGADYLVTVKLSLRRRRFVAKAELIRASDGNVLETAERGYSGAKAALSAGRAIGKLLGKRAVELGRPAPVEEEPPPREVATAPVTPVEPPPSARAVEPDDDEDRRTSVEAEIDQPTAARSGREDGILRASIGGGTQIASAYTVVVGGEATGLAYSLTPLALVNANLVVRIPQIGLFLGARADFSPVKYAIDVAPPVDPAEPSGRFLSAGGTIGYEALDLAFSESVRFRLSPVVGIGWDSLSVQSQGDNSIVVSWDAINANGGLELSLILADAVAISIEGRGGYIFSYGEKPKTTGEGGSGFDVLAGFGVRWWLIDLLGLYLDGVYEYMKVGMNGMGSRVGFVDDDPIVDATIFSADFKVGLGVVLGI